MKKFRRKVETNRYKLLLFDGTIPVEREYETDLKERELVSTIRKKSDNKVNIDGVNYDFVKVLSKETIIKHYECLLDDYVRIATLVNVEEVR